MIYGRSLGSVLKHLFEKPFRLLNSEACVRESYNLMEHSDNAEVTFECDFACTVTTARPRASLKKCSVEKIINNGESNGPTGRASL